MLISPIDIGKNVDYVSDISKNKGIRMIIEQSRKLNNEKLILVLSEKFEQNNRLIYLFLDLWYIFNLQDRQDLFNKKLPHKVAT